MEMDIFYSIDIDGWEGDAHTNKADFTLSLR